MVTNSNGTPYKTLDIFVLLFCQSTVSLVMATHVNFLENVCLKDSAGLWRCGTQLFSVKFAVCCCVNLNSRE